MLDERPLLSWSTPSTGVQSNSPLVDATCTVLCEMMTPQVMAELDTAALRVATNDVWGAAVGRALGRSPNSVGAALSEEDVEGGGTQDARQRGVLSARDAARGRECAAGLEDSLWQCQGPCLFGNWQGRGSDHEGVLGRALN